MNQTWLARFDGGCRPNPNGKAFCACSIRKDGVLHYRDRCILGEGDGMSSNVAEFGGLLLVLNWLIRFGVSEPVTVISDSQVIVHRMQSRTKASGLCESISRVALERLRQCRCPITFIWQKREMNGECDRLVRGLYGDD